jgi:hypothetical protein
MTNFFSKVTFLLLICCLYACMPDGFTSKPRAITISKRKAKEIQTRRYRPHEYHRYDRGFVRWDIISANKSRKYSPMEGKRYSVNSNSKNRKLNKQMVARKRKQDVNYRYYKESMDEHQESEKSNFSIYDK